MRSIRRTGHLTAWALLGLVAFGCSSAEKERDADAQVESMSSLRPALIPAPYALRETEGFFEISPGASVYVESDRQAVIEAAIGFRNWLREAIGVSLPVLRAEDGKAPARSIVFTTTGVDPRVGEEGYEILARPDLVTVRAQTPAGLFYATQTLRQLLPADFERGRPTNDLRIAARIPCVTIADFPRFAWRGVLLDSARHFMPKETVLRLIDQLAVHKMNVLHWHLTDDQGWRVEIPAYPSLTQVGAWRTTEDGRREGGYYTRDDIREIVLYAARRHITIVPEIEMPGHATAAIASYPELSCHGGHVEVATGPGPFDETFCPGKESTFTFLEAVLDEVMQSFPSRFVHIGGDECSKKYWRESAECRQRIEAEGLADEDELQSWFVRRIAAYVQSKGRRIIGWDEILEGGPLPPSAAVQSWRGTEGAIEAARRGHDAIVSPTSHCYLDYPQSEIEERPDGTPVLTLEQVYSFDPMPAGLSEKESWHILGTEAALWSERIPPERLDHQAFPRLCAIAEAAWSAPHTRDLEGFLARLERHYARLDALGVRYFVAAAPTD